MCKSNIILENEQPSHKKTIDALNAKIFGPGRFIRAAFKLRQGTTPDLSLSFIAKENDEIIGSVRQTPIYIGEHQALLLGPLGISSDHRNKGIGKFLLQQATKAAQNISQSPYELILLVGDYAYYNLHGFEKVPHQNILFPWPVNYQRVLAFELKKDALKRIKGMAR